MKAVILAAGQGTRLMPLTADRPKCLVELEGKSMLRRIMDVMAAVGVDDITIVAGYKHEKISAAAPGCKVILNPDYANTNMVTTLFCAPDLFRDSGHDLVISYSDIAYEPRVAQALAESDAPVAVVVNGAWRHLWELRMEDPLKDAETLKLDDRGHILELGKKARNYSEIQGQFAGLIKIRSDCLPAVHDAYRMMDRSKLYDGQPFPKLYTTSFIQHLIDAGWDVRAVPVDGGWLEVDTLDDLNLYHRLADEKRLSEIYRYAG